MRVAVTVEQSWHVVPGGIARSTVELLRALVARGDVELVGVAAAHGGPPPDAFLPPVPVRSLRLPRRVLYESWQWLRRPRVERATGPVDVVHDAGYVVPPSSAPLVATVHDLFFLEYPEHYTWHSRSVLRRGLTLARRDARLVICPSRATIEACLAAGVDEERLRLVPWGVRTREVEESKAEATRRRYGIQRPYVLFCGTVEPRKNLPRVLEAFRRLDRPDVELVLAGPQGWREDLGDGAASLAGRVRSLGFVPPAGLDALYHGAAALVYPSLGEGFGLPVLEAMAQGVPVVTSKGTATEEVAGEAAVLVDPLDVDAIAGGIERVIGDATLAAALGAAARARAAEFTWDRTAELVAAVYAEAAGSAT
jgi:glycosyltransferase involved in cell wall biosynthesis